MDDPTGAESIARTGAPALDAAMKILRLLSAAPYPLQLTEICERTGLAQASAHRILQSMLHHQLVALGQGRGKTYAVGGTVFELSSTILGRQPLVRFFNPIAEVLRNEIHRTILLSLPVGDQMVIVARLDDSACNPPGAYVGRAMPLAECAAGVTVLASRASERGMRPAEETAVQEDILRAARLGYAIRLQEFGPETGCLAAPVRNGLGAVVATIGACFADATLTPQGARSYSKTVVQAARQLSSHIL